MISRFCDSNFSYNVLASLFAGIFFLIIIELNLIHSDNISRYTFNI